MTAFKSEQRQLQNIADDLLADECFASLVALFNDQPLPARRGHTSASPRHPGVHRSPHWRGIRGLRVLWLLAACAVPAALTAAIVTGIPVLLVGVVPAFLLFARPGWLQ